MKGSYKNSLDLQKVKIQNYWI